MSNYCSDWGFSDARDDFCALAENHLTLFDRIIHVKAINVEIYKKVIEKNIINHKKSLQKISYFGIFLYEAHNPKSTKPVEE